MSVAPQCVVSGGRILEKTLTLLSRIFAGIACISLIAVMLITFLDVVGRYFFNAPLTFAVELIQLGVGLIVLFGLAATTLERGHIAVDLIEGVISRGAHIIVAAIAGLCGAVFMALMAWRLWDRGVTFRGDGLATDILFLPVWPVVLLMSVAAALAAVVALVQIVKPGFGGRPSILDQSEDG